MDLNPFLAIHQFETLTEPHPLQILINLAVAYSLILIVWSLSHKLVDWCTFDHFTSELVKDLYHLEPVVNSPAINTFNINFDQIKREVFGYGVRESFVQQ